MADSGLVLITPTSIAKTGGSSTATIGTNGSVTFTLCESISLNGVFSSTYDNYMVVARSDSGSGGSQNVIFRLRLSGTDASGANYTWQWLQADGTTVNGVRTSSATNARVGLYAENTKVSGSAFYLFGPFLSQATAMRSKTAGGYLNAYLIDYVATHSLTTSYDGFTMTSETAGSTFGGRISVYGLRQ